MSGVSKERLREIIEKYAGIEAGFGGDEIASLVGDEVTGGLVESLDEKLILQLVDVLVRKAELKQIEELDWDDVASIVADYFPLMSYQPEACVRFLEESLAEEI